MTIPYIMSPGEVAPFLGTGEEADKNIMTHSWKEVEQKFQPHIPEAWKKQTGIENFPLTSHVCTECAAKWNSQQSYYPCGQEERLDSRLILSRPPGKPKYSSEQ